MISDINPLHFLAGRRRLTLIGPSEVDRPKDDGGKHTGSGHRYDPGGYNGGKVLPADELALFPLHLFLQCGVGRCAELANLWICGPSVEEPI